MRSGNVCKTDCRCGRHNSKPRHAYDESFRTKISETSAGRVQSPETRGKHAKAHTTHGESGGGGKRRTVEYTTWFAMTGRCRDMTPGGYGARGITVCERWLTYENFLADMGRRPVPGYSIDRYPDGNGNYEPGNVRWATVSQQNKNRPNFNPKKARKCEPGCTCGKHVKIITEETRAKMRCQPGCSCSKHGDESRERMRQVGRRNAGAERG